MMKFKSIVLCLKLLTCLIVQSVSTIVTIVTTFLIIWLMMSTIAENKATEK